MPSEFNHIDEFFRSKEEESTAKTNQQEKHWQQMKDILVVPGPPTVKIRTINTRLYWQAAAGIIILAAFAYLLNRNNPVPDIVAENKKPSQNQKIADTVIKDLKDEKVNYTVEKKSINSNSFSFIIKSDKQINRKADPRNNNSILPPGNSIDNLTDTNDTTLHSQSKTPDLIFTESRLKLDLVFEQLKKPSQEFIVNSKHDTTIICKEGTSIFIPANSFQTALGLSVSTPIKLYVQEFYSFADIIGNKLTTNSNGEIIATAGMLFMNAKSGNELVQIKPGSELGLQMPTRKFDPQMQLFTGETKSTVSFKDESGDTLSFSGNNINWIPAGQKQFRYPNKKKMVFVLNLSDNPQVVFYKHPFNPSKMKSVAKFYVPWYCNFTNAEMQEKLEAKFSRYYDEIRVKRTRKPRSEKARMINQTRDAVYFYESRFVGDTVTMHIRTATRLKYITKEDSINYEAKWKKELEEAVKRNRSYYELIQLNDQYDFKITSLGWINCDRFMDYPKEKITDLKFSKSEEFKDTYFHSVLVFNKTNVLLQGYSSDNQIIFSRIPKGQSVSLVCIGVKDGKLISCIRSLTVSDTEIKDLKFSETTPEELKEKLRQFGSVDQRG